MFNISSYLSRAVGVIDKNVLHNKSVSDIIQKHSGVNYPKSFFEIKEGILRTSLSPAEKMLLFMKKESILLDLAPFGIKDIR